MLWLLHCAIFFCNLSQAFSKTLLVGGVYESPVLAQVFEDAVSEFNVELHQSASSCPWKSGFIFAPLPLFVPRENTSFLRWLDTACNGLVRSGVHLVIFGQQSAGISMLSHLAGQIFLPSINNFPATWSSSQGMGFCEVRTIKCRIFLDL